MQEGPKTTQRAANQRIRKTTRPGSPSPEVVAKKGGFPVGMLIAAALGILFVSYLTNAGNVQTTIDAFFSAQVHSAHTHDDFVTTWFVRLLPYVALALCMAFLYVMLASFGVGKAKRKPQPKSETLTVHEFAEIVAEAGIGPRVSREMYRLLLPDYARTMRTTLTTTFTALDVSTETVWGMFEELVQKSGGIIRGSFGIEALGTPIEMMQAADQCVERAALERRATLQRTTTPLEETHRTVVPVPAGHQR